MNLATLEDVYIPTLTRAADRLARLLIDGARAGRSRKELLETLTARTRSIRGRCLVCATEWPLMLFGREQARHICVVARRASFVSLRRRLEEHFRRARLRCPVCTSRRAVADAESGARGYIADANESKAAD